MVVRAPAALLRARFRSIRGSSEELCRPLSPEDMLLQSMPDASPAKWHLGHTTWFFETFVLGAAPPFRAEYGYIFNSYYDAVGPRHPRPERGLLSRPTLDEVGAYRRHVDSRIEALLEDAVPPGLLDVIELGLNHEQQHQELILTDVKHAFSRNPLEPTYRPGVEGPTRARGPARWVRFEEQIAWLGAADGFSFDNERPRHRELVAPFELASRLATVADFRAFIEEGGYRRPELWLSDGWRARSEKGWERPLYWSEDGQSCFTLGGRRPLALDEPVLHVSFYEADAFARWAGARLPREAEWELAATKPGDLEQLHGVAWQWTASPYTPYPGFRPAAGALGEYNAKFMCNQLVLRGSSWATPAGHARSSYRNFWGPETRFQATGVRLARDVAG